MRKSLIEMLDGVGLPTAFDIPSTGLLFSVKRQYLHSTSVLCYPVFVDAENYTCHKPSLLMTPVFRQYITDYFREKA